MAAKTALLLTIGMICFSLACGLVDNQRSEPSSAPNPGPETVLSEEELNRLVQEAIEAHQQRPTADKAMPSNTPGTEQATGAEAAALPTIETAPTAANASRGEFARCLNQVSQDIALLPWEYDVQDPETGTTWDLNDYANDYRTVHFFIIQHCRHMAPIAVSKDEINRCMIDSVAYIREGWPGGHSYPYHLDFALTVCFPPYQP